jgi:hypothetical protein
MANRLSSIAAQPRALRGVLSVLWLPPLVWACAGTTELVPARGPTQGKAKTAAVATSPAGVKVVADPAAWDKEHASPLDSLAVKVKVTNERTTPITLTRSGIALVGDKETMPALSADKIDVRPVRTTLGEDPADPEPSLGLMESTTPGLVSHADNEPNGGTVTVQAAKREAERFSLPEGAIPPGHFVEGYVFFERMPEANQRLDLELAIKASADGPVVTTVALPFRVRED